MTTRRPLVAALVTLCGVAITAGAALPWVDARGPRPASGIAHTSLSGLRHFSYTYSGTASSLAIPVAAAGILVLIGGLAAWRLLTGPLSVVALASATLWIGLNAYHYHPTDLRYNDLRTGAWLTITGGLIAALATLWMRRKDASADTSPWDSVTSLVDDDRPDMPFPAQRAPAAWHPGPGTRPRWPA